MPGRSGPKPHRNRWTVFARPWLKLLLMLPNDWGAWRTKKPVTVLPAHKKLKNEFAAKNVWESIRDMKTVGVIAADEKKRIFDIAWPMGVVAALTPSTNPTSTVIYKILIAVKARDAIVIAPHPSAAKCCYEATATDGTGS